MARLDELKVFAAEHDLAIISIADLIAWRRRTEKQVDARRRGEDPDRARRVPRGRLPSRCSTAPTTSRWSRGDIGDGEDVLVRVHSECLTGDVFGSRRCDCGPQLDAALRGGRRRGPRRRALRARPRGPRHRPDAQAAGLLRCRTPAPTPSTPTSSSACRPTPATTAPARRSSSTSASAPCGCSPTTRPSAPGSRATASRSSAGVPLPVHATPENLRYLQTKRDRMGHDLPGLAAFEDEATEASATHAPGECRRERRRARPRRRSVDARGADAWPIVATRWHDEITSALLDSARPHRGRVRRRRADRRARRAAPSSCRSSRRRSPPPTTPSPRSASSCAAAPRTSSTSATP